MSQDQDKDEPSEVQGVEHAFDSGQADSRVVDGHKLSENPDLVVDESERDPGAFVPNVAQLPEDESLYLRRGDGKGKKGWKVPTLGWFVFAGLLLGGAIIALEVVLDEPPEPEEKLTVLEVELAEPQQNGEVKKIRNTLEELNSCARGYLKEDTIKGKLAYVRHPKRVRPLMAQYYESHQMEAKEFQQFESYRAVKIDGSSFVVGRVVMVDGSRRALLLEHLENGSFKVDWESDVCYLPVPWDEFVSKRPTEHLVMRVHARPDNFYAYGFDEDRYDCFQLTAQGSDDYLFGYTVKGGEASIAMRTFFMQTRKLAGDKAEPVTLLLRFPEDGGSKKCVHIDRMMAPRWIFVRGDEARVAK